MNNIFDAPSETHPGFNYQIDSDLAICAKCGDPLRNPVIHLPTCQAIVCSDCYLDPACPCCKSAEGQKVACTIKHVQNALAAVKANCNHCRVTLKLAETIEHRDQKCVHECSCGKSSAGIVEYKAHRENECTQNCPSCGKVVIRAGKEAHEKLECPVVCRDCNMMCAGSEGEEIHKRDACLAAIISCGARIDAVKFVYAGKEMEFPAWVCPSQVSRRQMSHHRLCCGVGKAKPALRLFLFALSLHKEAPEEQAEICHMLLVDEQEEEKQAPKPVVHQIEKRKACPGPTSRESQKIIFDRDGKSLKRSAEEATLIQMVTGREMVIPFTPNDRKGEKPRWQAKYNTVPYPSTKFMKHDLENFRFEVTLPCFDPPRLFMYSNLDTYHEQLTNALEAVRKYCIVSKPRKRQCPLCDFYRCVQNEPMVWDHIRKEHIEKVAPANKKQRTESESETEEESVYDLEMAIQISREISREIHIDS